jgi:hypothetical protein
MNTSLLIAFDEFPEELRLVSRMILAYGEIEFAFLDILGAVFKNSQTAIRTLYQLRSETHRLTVAEAIAMPWFESAGLGGQFNEAVNAAKKCKKIRNQYAHCQFIASDGVLRFCNLEKTATSKGAKCEVRATPITLEVLQEQSAYFDYADHQVLWVNHSYRVKNGLEVHHGGPFPKPKRIPPPRLDSRA